jgi:hypothetical protein
LSIPRGLAGAVQGGCQLAPQLPHIFEIARQRPRQGFWPAGQNCSPPAQQFIPAIAEIAHRLLNLLGQLDLPGQALLDLGNGRLALAFGFFGLLLAYSSP